MSLFFCFHATLSVVAVFLQPSLHRIFRSHVTVCLFHRSPFFCKHFFAAISFAHMLLQPCSCCFFSVALFVSNIFRSHVLVFFFCSHVPAAISFAYLSFIFFCHFLLLFFSVAVFVAAVFLQPSHFSRSFRSHFLVVFFSGSCFFCCICFSAAIAFLRIYPQPCSCFFL